MDVPHYEARKDGRYPGFCAVCGWQEDWHHSDGRCPRVVRRETVVTLDTGKQCASAEEVTPWEVIP